MGQRACSILTNLRLDRRMLLALLLTALPARGASLHLREQWLVSAPAD